MTQPTSQAVAIIQARMGSSRLPGKVLLDIEGQTMLARTVSRVRQASRIATVVVATTVRPEDAAVVEEAVRLAVPWFRGSENDVLDRYYQAASQFCAAVVVRITSDCPLIDPEVIDEVVGSFFAATPAVDYASNTLKRTYPRGLDTEVMTFGALEHAWRDARPEYQREHVTPYLYEHPETFRLLQVSKETDDRSLRWTVDTQEDLTLMRAIYRTLGTDGRFGWRDVMALMKRSPDLALLNRHIVQKPANPAVSHTS